MQISFLFNLILIIFLFLSLTSLGYLANKKIFKINISNFYENFIVGIFILLLYLQIHIFFLEIDFAYTIHLFVILSISLIISLKQIIINKKILLAIFLSSLVMLNADRFPYQNYIYDFGYYHNGYLNWLNQENLVRGLAHIHPSYGYTGNSYLLGSFLNIYPLLNTGYIFTTSLFFVFYIFFSINEFNKTKLPITKIYLLFSYYIILKYILEEPLGDYSPYKINLILFLYLFYKLLNLFGNKIFQFHEFFLIIISISILISLSPVSWFFSLILVLLLMYRNKKEFFKKMILISILYLVLFFLINFFKSGHLLYPLQSNFFNVDFATTYDFLYQIKNFPKSYLPGLDWVLPWFKSSFLKSSFCIIYAFTFVLIVVSLFLSNIRYERNFQILLYPLLILNLSMIFWFFNSPDLKTGKVFFWVGIVLTTALIYVAFIEKFINRVNKLFKIATIDHYILVIVCIVSFISSLDNLIFSKMKISRNEAIKNFPITKEVILKNNHSIDIRILDYTSNKMTSTAENKSYKYIEYIDNFFPKIFINK